MRTPSPGGKALIGFAPTPEEMMRRFTLILLAASAAGCGSSGSAALLDEYILSDQDLVPESGDFDTTTQAFYVGSWTDGSLTRVDADGTETVVYTPPAAEGWGALGVAIDVEQRRLWVCMFDPANEATDEVWVISLETLARTHTLALPSVENASCNDIALDSDGRAYITDSATPNIYRGDLDAEEITAWATDPLLPGPGLFGLNGIDVTSDDQYVLASSTLSPELFRITLAEPPVVTTIAVSGDLGEENADGMSIVDGQMYLSFASRVRRFSTTDDWETATFVSSPSGEDGLSTVIRANGRAYAVFSDIIDALTQSPLDPPFRIFRVDNAMFE